MIVLGLEQVRGGGGRVKNKEKCQRQLFSRNGGWGANAAGVERLKDIWGGSEKALLLVQVPELGTTCHPGSSSIWYFQMTCSIGHVMKEHMNLWISLS